MRRTRQKLALPACGLAASVALFAVGCGEQEIEVSKQDPGMREGAEIFNQRCSGCHTLSAAASSGSVPEGQLKYSERTNGPNLDTRKESAKDVLFALRNGGFSGAIMPANIVVGDDANLVARFVCAYAGQPKDKPKPASECTIPPQLR